MTAAASFDGPLIGGRWRLGPALGKGAQAETFLAREEDAGVKVRGALGIAAARAADDARKSGPFDVVVVKRLVPRGTWKSFELFEREARVLSQLRHPGVPRFLATIEEPPGTFNIVMQRMPGDNLRDLVDKRRLSEIELVDILTRTLEVLDYLHTRTPAVVHRDIKPSNIVRSPDGKIALVDFGGVLDVARDKGGSTIVGTFGYMAPEQLHGQATPATDIYSLGATIVALAGGIEPEDIPRKGLRMDLDAHLKTIDPGLRRALAAMTDPDPDVRPQRARDVIALLAKATKSSSRSKALVKRGEVTPATRTVRKLFPTVPEPVGTALRLGVFAFGGAGWLGMLFVRFYLALLIGVFSIIAFPARSKIKELGDELDLMLKEGQGGFGDISRHAIGRRTRRALPPGDR